MLMLKRRHRTGFTIVELVVVVVVLVILSAIVLVTYTSAQARGRDSKRMSQLNSIAEAITSYRLKYGDPASASCAAGNSNTGSGWFNDNTDSGYSATILSCLTAKGYLDSGFADPSGCSNNGTASAPGYSCNGQGYGYVKLTCTDPNNSNQTATVLLAKLETSGSTSNLTGSNALCGSDAPWANTYGYNYMVRVD